MKCSDKGPSGLLNWVSGQVLPRVGAEAGPRRRLVSPIPDICFLLGRFSKSSWDAILFPNQTFLQQEQTRVMHPSIRRSIDPPIHVPWGR